jgi:hypothetical protein
MSWDLNAGERATMVSNTLKSAISQPRCTVFVSGMEKEERMDFHDTLVRKDDGGRLDIFELSGGSSTGARLEG